MKSIDIRSESAVKLLAEFLDMDTDRSGGGDERQNAQHFAHGESFLPVILLLLRTDVDLG